MVIQCKKERVTIHCEKENIERQVSFKVEKVPFGDRGERRMVEAFSFDCEFSMCNCYRKCEIVAQDFLDRKYNWKR